MDIYSYFETLRAKKESERKRIAFIATAVATFLVFGTWMATFSLPSLDTRQIATVSAAPSEEDSISFIDFVKTFPKTIIAGIDQILGKGETP